MGERVDERPGTGVVDLVKATEVTERQDGRECAEEIANGYPRVCREAAIGQLAGGEESDLDGALGWIDEAAARDPEAWRPPFHRGEILRLLGENDGALAAFAVARWWNLADVLGAALTGGGA